MIAAVQYAKTGDGTRNGVMGRPRLLSRAHVAAAVSMYVTGSSCAEIARQANVSESTVRYALRREGVKKSSRGRS